MGIQINGITDTILASDGSLSVEGYSLTGNSSVNVTGITTTGTLNVTGNATVANLNVTGVTTSTNFVGSAATFSNLTVNGTQTIINTNVLEVADINIGIASTATKLTNSQLNGAGFTIYGSQGDKTLSWDNSNTRLSFNTDVYAPRYYGDGSGLSGVTAGLTLRQAGSTIAGGAATTVNFASGATITNVTSGIATITVGITTASYTASGITTILNLSSAQDHKVTATGITTITVSGGTEGDSHTVRIVNSGIATVGFSTFFLFPSGSPPVLPTTSGAISLISFTVHRAGSAGISTQLLAGASLNFS
jgi:hypothetical protein